MSQISGLTQEKTSLVDNDLMAIDDSQATNRSKKVKFSTIWNYIIGKLIATASEINAVCAGNTASASEISQICDGRVAGGGGINDLITAGATQLMINKGLTSPKFNGDSAEMVCISKQINTLQYTTGSGRVNEVQQGLAVGNPTITSPGSYAYHGLVNLNFASSDIMSFGPVSSFNVSEQILIKNLSATTTVTVDRISSDSFYLDGNGYTSMKIGPNGAVKLTAIGGGKFIVDGYAEVTFS